MKILYSVHRYGAEVVGGAETACRLFAEQLVNRGHEVDVLTSCALSYVDWADAFEPGKSTLNGVRVHRLPVVQPRDPVSFSGLHAEIMKDPAHCSFSEQRRWLREMGPVLKGHSRQLLELSEQIDIAVFMTYMYPTTAFGVPVLAGRVPVSVQPTLHDEPPAYVPWYRSLIRAADSLLFLTPEEEQIAHRLFGAGSPSVVTGIGIDSVVAPFDEGNFRSRHGLGDDPYLIYVGRIDTFKGVSELMRYFVEFKGRNPSNLRLVLAGERVMEIPEVSDIRYVGFLDETEKMSAISGSVALVQPSPFESFSIVLCESWQLGKPTLVQGHSNVLRGQCGRSEGGLPYDGFAEFEVCLSLLLNNPALAAELGANGRRYVEQMYTWRAVMDRMEEGLELGLESFQRRVTR